MLMAFGRAKCNNMNHLYEILLLLYVTDIKERLKIFQLGKTLFWLTCSLAERSFSEFSASRIPLTFSLNLCQSNLMN